MKGNERFLILKREKRKKRTILQKAKFNNFLKINFKEIFLKEKKNNQKSNGYSKDVNKELTNEEEINPWKKRWEQENKSRINLQQQYNLLINCNNKEPLRNKDHEANDDQDDELQRKEKNNGLFLENNDEKNINKESKKKIADKMQNIQTDEHDLQVLRNDLEKKNVIIKEKDNDIQRKSIIRQDFEKKISDLIQDLKQKEYEIAQLKPKISNLFDEKQIANQNEKKISEELKRKEHEISQFIQKNKYLDEKSLDLEKKISDLIQNLRKKDHEISQFNIMQNEIEKFTTEMKFKNESLSSQKKNLSEELKIKENIINDLKENAWDNMKNQKIFLQSMNHDDKRSESFFNGQIKLLEQEINIYEDLFGKQKKEFDEKIRDANHQEKDLKNLNKELKENLKNSEENCNIFQIKIEEENNKYKELIDTINLLAKQERGGMSLDQNLSEISEKAKKYCNFDRDFSGTIRLILEVNRSQKNLNEKNEALNKELNILMKIRKEKEIKSNTPLYPENSCKNENNMNNEEKELITSQNKYQKNFMKNENFLKNSNIPSYTKNSSENEIIFINSNVQFDREKNLIKEEQIHQENSEKNSFINLNQQVIEQNDKEIFRHYEKKLKENELN